VLQQDGKKTQSPKEDINFVFVHLFRSSDAITHFIDFLSNRSPLKWHKRINQTNFLILNRPQSKTSIKWK